MNYGTIKTMDTANGPGLRVSLFVSGCPHACPGCFNAEAWDFKFGQPYTQETKEYLLKEVGKDFVSGITFLGGEPLTPENQEEVRNTISLIKEHCPEKSIRCFSGYSYEFITQWMFENLPHTKDIVSNLDVLVDGKFIQNLLDLKLKFRGSRNQRVIDVKKSLEIGSVVWSDAVDDKDLYFYVPTTDFEKFGK